MNISVRRFGLSRIPRSSWVVAGVLSGALLCLPAASVATSISKHDGPAHGSKGSATSNHWLEFLSFLKIRFDGKPFPGRGNPPKTWPPGLTKRPPIIATSPTTWPRADVVPISDTRPSTALPSA